MHSRADHHGVLVDVQSTLRWVDIAHPESCQFAPPQTRVRQHLHQQAIRARGGREAGHLLMRDDELVYLYLEESEGADEIAEMLFESINDLIDELISRPRRTEELRKLMPKSVLDSINRRRETS